MINGRRQRKAAPASFNYKFLMHWPFQEPRYSKWDV